MPVSILKLARAGEGASQTCTLEFDNLEDVNLASPAKVSLTIYNLSDGSVFQAIGSIEAEIKQVCDRCLKTFSHKVDLQLHANFADQPQEDDWPIIGNAIDFAPVVRETILLHLPVKNLCTSDCTGIKVRNN